jgi:hypothetical protein
MSRRWILLVPSKMVKLFAQLSLTSKSFRNHVAGQASVCRQAAVVFHCLAASDGAGAEQRVAAIEQFATWSRHMADRDGEFHWSPSKATCDWPRASSTASCLRVAVQGA